MFSQYLCATADTNTASQPALGWGDVRAGGWGIHLARHRGGDHCDRRWGNSFGETPRRLRN